MDEIEKSKLKAI
jgi:hypothetical protein